MPYSSTQLLIAALQSRPRQHLHQVLCPEGFYKGSAKLAAAAGLSIRTFPVDLHRDGVMTPERLANYLARHHRETALLWLTMPGNPLIGRHSMKQLEAIGKIIVQSNLDVLIDMAFDKLLPQDAYPPLPNIRVPDAQGQLLYGRTFAITGNSKGFAAAGPWKLGAGVCGNPQWRRKTLNLVTAITFQREATHLIHAGLSNISEAYLENSRKTLQRIQQNVKQRIQQINQKLGDEVLFSYGDPVYTPFHCLGVHASYLHKAGIRDSCQLADFLLKECSIPILSINMSSERHPVNFCEGWYAYTCKEASTVSIKSIYTNAYALEVEDAVIIFGEFGLTDNIEKSVFDKLSGIFEFLSNNKFNYMVRSWNFIPDINSTGSGAMENYRAFCKGRSKAFQKLGIDAIRFPAATGVDSHANNIYGYIWASKSDKFINMENSLQMPAYQYPKQYGPRSPSFAKGKIFSCNAGKNTMPDKN